jgi:hypothetical protein
MLPWIIVIGLAFLIICVLQFQTKKRQPEMVSIPPDQKPAIKPRHLGRPILTEVTLLADKRFRSRHKLMSPAEVSLFGVLNLLFGDDYVIFSKVRMCDVLEPVQAGNDRRSAFNEISQKHIDFLICRASTTEFVCAVELDDASHRRPDRVARDSFVDTIFSGAGVPLIRVPTQAAYSIQSLREKFERICQYERREEVDDRRIAA